MFRTTTRLLRTFSTLNSLKNPVRRLTMLPRYQFSNAHPNSGAPLVEILQSEIQYEQENSPSNQTLLQIIQKEGWEVTSKQTLIEMTKQLGSKTIHVVFFAEPLHPEEQEGNEETEREESFGEYTEFTVYVKKQGSEKILYADFLSNEEEIRIVNVNFTTDYNTHKLVPKHNRPLTTYQGPDVYTLETQFRNNLGDYFLELGVNPELVSFIQEFSINSEHPFYVNWLQDLHSFVK